jgi:hypothetical protein
MLPPKQWTDYSDPASVPLVKNHEQCNLIRFIFAGLCTIRAREPRHLPYAPEALGEGD